MNTHETTPVHCGDAEEARLENEVSLSMSPPMQLVPLNLEPVPLSHIKEEESILGVYVYRFISPTRYTCSLIPSGAVGIVNFNSVAMVPENSSNNLPQTLQKATPEAPVTLLFKDPLPPHQLAWSSEKKCFICELQKVQVIIL